MSQQIARRKPVHSIAKETARKDNLEPPERKSALLLAALSRRLALASLATLPKALALESRSSLVLDLHTLPLVISPFIAGRDIVRPLFLLRGHRMLDLLLPVLPDEEKNRKKVAMSAPQRKA